MPELLLHYIWQKRLFAIMPQQTTDGRKVEVLDVGTHNLDAGPDFFAATIRIDGVTLAGNIEIHVKSSDWQRHGHHTDPAYDTVILHVVKQADKEVFTSRGECLPQCELKYPHDPDYLQMMLADRGSLCSARLACNPEMITDDWRKVLLRDRMLAKAASISQLLQLTGNAWNEAYYVTLAHHFGFHTNGLPFELLAKHTPLAYLQKHRSSQFQLEAMLMGQSGLLTEATASDAYTQKLWREYSFLQKKFGLTPLDGSMWKMMRMRPQNFPQLRISQFAALLHKSEFLLSHVIETQDPKALRELFQVDASDYWQERYHVSGTMGKSAIDSLLINTVVPYKYAWGRAHMNLQLQHDAVGLLKALPAETNSIVQSWKTLGQTIRTAEDSQAYLQLYREYCERQRCLSCDVGFQIFTPEAM